MRTSRRQEGNNAWKEETMKWLSWEGGANAHGGVVGCMNPQGPHERPSDGQTSPLRRVVLSPATAALLETLPLKKQGSLSSAHSARLSHLEGFSLELLSETRGSCAEPMPRTSLSSPVSCNSPQNGRHTPRRINQMYKTVTRKLIHPFTTV